MVTPFESSPSSSVKDSGDQRIDGLLEGHKWGGGVGATATVTYSFPNAESVWSQAWLGGYGLVRYPSQPGYHGLNDAQQAQCKQAMDAWSAVANITFEPIDNNGQRLGVESKAQVGDIRVAFTDNLAQDGIGFSPDQPPSPFRGAPRSGDIWLDNKMTNSDWNHLDSATRWLFMHELGHAIGLKHPSEAQLLFFDKLPDQYDNFRYTVMSYKTGDNNDSYPATPMLYDVLAVQYLYGANTSYHSGNDTYRFTNAELRTIWDAGGTDIFELSDQTTAATADLRPGSFSSIGLQASGNPARDNVAIAFGVHIENVRGTHYADTITGNDWGNEITGGPGADKITTGAGSDILLYTDRTEGVDTVTDFTPGSDTFDFSAIFTPAQGAAWTKYVKLTGQTDGTLVSIDPSGASGAFTDMALLQGVRPDQFKAADFGLPEGPPPVGTFSIAPAAATVGEKAGTVSFTMTRSDASAAQTVYVSTVQDKGFANDGDYVGKLNEALTFAAGDLSEPVIVTILDDTIREDNETFDLIVQKAPTDPITDYLAAATFTIEDDDGAPPSAVRSIVRVSTDKDGNQANSNSIDPVFSPDGSRLAFESYASNLVPGDTNDMWDIFVKDLASGAITRVSTAADGGEGNNTSDEPAFSPDGSKVAFSSIASNLVPGDAGRATGVFVKDLASGAITLVSTAADGSEPNGHSSSPAFSPDGSRLAFASSASNLVPGDTNRALDIFVKDLASGAITRVSTAADGSEGNDISYDPVFSPDGSKVAFESYASNLVPGDTNGNIDIFVKDLASGAITRVSSAADGSEGNLRSYGPAFSPDGSKVAFFSDASNLVPGDTNGRSDIFVKDLASGAITRVSTAANGTEGNGGSFVPAFSPDGSRLAFHSSASNLVPGDTNNVADIFVKDLATGAITRVSTAADGTEANGASRDPAFSPDGRYVAFDSYASNLVPDDTNDIADIFVVTLNEDTFLL